MGKLGCLLLLFFLAGAAVGAFCWPYTINSWLVYAGKQPQIVWWHGALMGFVPGIGQFAIVGAVFTWIVMMFLS